VVPIELSDRPFKIGLIKGLVSNGLGQPLWHINKLDRAGPLTVRLVTRYFFQPNWHTNLHVPIS